MVLRLKVIVWPVEAEPVHGRTELNHCTSVSASPRVRRHPASELPACLAPGPGPINHQLQSVATY